MSYHNGFTFGRGGSSRYAYCARGRIEVPRAHKTGFPRGKDIRSFPRGLSVSLSVRT
jgi:hypothetical protein